MTPAPSAPALHASLPPAPPMDVNDDDDDDSGGSYHMPRLLRSPGVFRRTPSKSEPNKTHRGDGTTATFSPSSPRMPPSASTFASLSSSSSPDDLLPSVSDRKAIVGCLAAVLASMHAYDTDDVDEEHFLSAYEAHCNVHTQYEDKDNSAIRRGPTTTALSSDPSTIPDDAGEGSVADDRGGGGAAALSPDDVGGVVDPDDGSSAPSAPVILSRNGFKGDVSGTENASNAATNALFGNRRRTHLAISRHKRRRYEIKLDLLRWATRLMMLEEADATALTPILTPLLSMEDCEDDVKSNEILRPFLHSLSSGRAGFQCVALLLFNYLLLSSTVSCSATDGKKSAVHENFVGYDARIRSAFKRLAMAVFCHDLMTDYAAAATGQKEAEVPKVDALEEFQDVDLLASDNDGSEGGEADEPDSLELTCLEERTIDSSDNDDETGIDVAVAKPPTSRTSDIEAAAMRKFEALEHTIACKLLSLSEIIKTHEMDGTTGAAIDPSHRKTGSDQQMAIVWERPKSASREKVIRAVKICSAGVVAGAVFGISGGLAAPGIAATIAMIGGSAVAATAAVVTLTSTIAVTTIFGVGGVGLVAAKVKNRTEGLTEFTFKRERNRGTAKMELSRAVCISGWLKDRHDFQRPWGVCPETLTDTQERLERFYSIHDPEKVPQCSIILDNWRGKEDELWELLHETYGRDPDTLFPLEGPVQAAALNDSENGAVDDLMEALGYPQLTRNFSPSQRSQRSILLRQTSTVHGRSQFCGKAPIPDAVDEVLGHEEREKPDCTLFDDDVTSPDENKLHPSGSFLSLSTMADESSCTSRPARLANKKNNEENFPAHLSCVWDYHSKYGGELYTVKWESELLWKLNDTVKSLGQEVAQSATLKVLEETALAAIASALVLPSNIMRCLKVIDGPWALAIMRADEAGVALAKSLLESKAGHRPVTLIGYSLGARVIYSCLKELALHQEKWEEQRERARNKDDPADATKSSEKKSGSAVWQRNRESTGQRTAEGDDGACVNHESSRLEMPGAATNSRRRRRWGWRRKRRDTESLSEDQAASDDASSLPTSSRHSTVSSSAEPEEGDDSPSPGPSSDDSVSSVDGTTENATSSCGKEEQQPKRGSSKRTRIQTYHYSREPASIVEDAILMGCPTYVHRPSWAACRRVVAGRLVNCYHPRDLNLLLMYQYDCMTGLFRPTCGTHAVRLSGVENYDVSSLVSVHSDYCLAIDGILQHIRYGQTEMLLKPEDYVKMASEGEDVPN